MESKKSKTGLSRLIKTVKDFILAVFCIYTKDYKEYLRNRYINGYYYHES